MIYRERNVDLASLKPGGHHIIQPELVTKGEDRCVQCRLIIPAIRDRLLGENGLG